MTAFGLALLCFVGLPWCFAFGGVVSFVFGAFVSEFSVQEVHDEVNTAIKPHCCSKTKSRWHIGRSTPNLVLKDC